jgi:hypothetical protein
MDESGLIIEWKANENIQHIHRQVQIPPDEETNARNRSISPLAIIREFIPFTVTDDDSALQIRPSTEINDSGEQTRLFHSCRHL